MLELRRLRLVNWHFFSDSTVDFGPTTLLAGDNGTGKSTIIDAVQYALVSQVSRIRFNSAASDRRAARTLESYCRCKIGSDAVDFVRGDCISHVMLEFAEGERRFCAGIMVEAFVEGDAREHEWIFENAVLEDIPVFHEDAFIPPRTFRDRLRQAGAHLCATKREYNARLTHLLGVYRRVGEFNPYLEAVVRSVSFTPFTSVNHFVCNYILDEHNVDVGAMKENLENYRIAEREALAVEQKMDRLAGIAKLSDEVLQSLRQILRQEYLHVRLRFEQAGDRLAAVARRTEETERDLANAREYYRVEDERKERLDAQRQEIHFALAENEQHRLYERLQRDREQAQRALAYEEERVARHDTLVHQCETLLGRPLAETLDAEEERVAGMVGDAMRESVQADVSVDAAKRELGELYDEQRELKAGVLRYPNATTELQAALAKAGIEASVFADLLEVDDESWHNAVEGWLNTQRFNVLVPEADFQGALTLYNSLPAKTAGVGLPNLAAMGDADALPGSLAEVVAAKNPAARRYAAFLLGDVIRAELDDLKTHGRAITAGCMAYSGHTARRVKPEVYERWYIGKQARERRLAAVEARIGELGREIEGLLARKRVLEESIDLGNRVLRTLPQIAELAAAADRALQLREQAAEIAERIASLDTSSFDELKLQITGLTQSIVSVEGELAELNQTIGVLTERVRTLAGEHESATSDLDRRRAAFDGFVAEHAEEEADLTAYFESRVNPERAAGSFSYDDFFRRYDSALTGIITRRDRARSSLRHAKQQYNHDFATLMELEADAAAEYRELLERYRRTELPEYRERIAHARAEAERQFREHFVARLNEHLIEAEESFKEINHILGTITFGRDQYRFTLARRPERRALLSAISTAAEVREDEGTLFEVLHEEEERESIERLFAQILTHDTDDPEIRDLCDYRQYFTYDIRIRHLDQEDAKTGKPLESYLSRVLREKSGGETQTPYYVAIAASFFRFYKDSPNAIRLVLFDEAFNKMDDERIGQMVDFFRKLSMQVVTAVPTEKLESIAPYMHVTNLVLRKNYRAFVRKYTTAVTDAAADENRAENGEIPGVGG
ncbi:MAG TPA: SbcC/MukB-like Walker B domain-containing protein [Spirochaetia bacterium]|nr:SbcC/MukB-like Walker B domain-containing protein [Spirochaetia bacterium]